MTTTTIDDLVAQADDFLLCDEVVQRLEGAADALGAEPTGAEERAIVLTWHASGVVGNGGFEYLFEGGFYVRDPGYAHTLAGFEAVGATAKAAALREALGWFPGSTPPEDPRARLAAFVAAPADERQRLNERFWAESDAFTTKLAGYIRANQAAVEDALRRYEERRPPGLPRGMAVVRCGDLRLCMPRSCEESDERPGPPAARLETLAGDQVVRTFDLTEWTPALESRLRWWPSLLAILVAFTLPFVRAHFGLPRWVAWPPGLLLIVVAAWCLDRRTSLVLRRGAERVVVRAWTGAELEPPLLSFLARVVVTAGADLDHGDDDDDGE